MGYIGIISYNPLTNHLLTQQGGLLPVVNGVISPYLWEL